MTAPVPHLHDRLRTLAQNLSWTWHPEVITLFTDLDPHLWREVDHNPTAFLNQITPEQIEERLPNWCSIAASTIPSAE